VKNIFLVFWIACGPPSLFACLSF